MTKKVYVYLLLVLLTLPLLWQRPIAAEQLPVDPMAFYDQDEVSWRSHRNQSYNAYVDTFNAIKDDYILLDIEVHADNDDQRRVSSVWQLNPTNRNWKSHSTLTHQQFSDQWQLYANQGYRLVDQESFILNGQQMYSGVWHENEEGVGWASYRNATSAEFNTNLATYEDDYIMIDFDVYLNTNDGHRLAAAWVENSADLDWRFGRAMNLATFTTWLNNHAADGFRPLKVDAYTVNGEQRFGAILVENTNGRTWSIYGEMSQQDYLNRWYEQRDLGLRLIDFERYESNGQTRYAGVWRQNNDRPDWSLKGDVDVLVDGQMDDFDVPGIGVAIAQAGEFKYLRGFGHADIDDNKWYNSRTINRLASVSKPVAGVLLMELIEDNAFDSVDDLTSAHATFPAHHTHTVGELASHRSGIGHYDELGWPPNTSVQYDTAQEAAELFKDDPLLFAPGTGCDYSTHAYTFFGAAVEGATGDPISQVVKEQISDPLGLSSLRAEDRSVYNYHRATIYNTDNSEVASPDNLSWKVLGGGLEASVYDMARLGMALLENDLLSADSLNDLWTMPDNLCNFAAYGWFVGVDSNGVSFAQANGGQAGANTYIRVLPDEEIVIVVLSNRRFGGHSSGTITNEIASLMLNEPPASVVIPPIFKQTPDSPPVRFPIANQSYTPVGGAQLERTTDGIILSNIGDTGRGGVIVDLPEKTNGYTTMLQPALPFGRDVGHTSGKITLGHNLGAGMSNELELEFVPRDSADPTTTQLLLTNVMTDQLTFEVEFVDNGKVVFARELTTANPTAQIDIGHGWECYEAYGFEVCFPTIIVVDCNDDMTECHTWTLNDVDRGWELEFAARQTTFDPNGGRIQFDTLRIHSRGANRNATQPIGQVMISAENFDSITLTPDVSSVPSAVTVSTLATTTTTPLPLLVMTLLLFATIILGKRWQPSQRRK